MARPLRIERAGAWYHVSGRGLERRKIFIDDADRRHWLELIEEARQRWRLTVYAYVLMDNHHHLMLETHEPNLGWAMHWLNTSYTAWFNRRRQRVGPLFQGRYKAILVDRLGWGLELSRYLHLNPVRRGGLGLDKKGRQARRVGAGGRPDSKKVQERLRTLRAYRWSSYRAYVGMVEEPAWLDSQTVLELAGRGLRKEQKRKYQRYVEEAVREGLEANPWEQLRGQLLLGSQQMWEQLRRTVRGNKREQPQIKNLNRRPRFAQIVNAVEGLKGEDWRQFRDRHGDWGRDLALYLGQRCGGMRLTELGKEVGGTDYAAVSAAVHRFSRRLQNDKKLAGLAKQIEAKLLKVEP